MRNIDLLINNGINVNGSLDLLGDIDTYNDILKEFFNEANEKRAKINEYKNKNDMSNYAISVHSLKSDAKYLGFTKLAELAYNHEMESKNNNIDYINEHYEELISEAKNIIKIVNEYFNGKENTGNDINNLNKKSILIADDSNIIRNIIEKMIGEQYKVIMAEDGMETINKINENSDNLIGIFLDLYMPNVNGFEVLKYLKENNMFNKIPVAIITGDDSKETIYKAFDYPIVDVLAKPFNENDVKRIITAMLNLK